MRSRLICFVLLIVVTIYFPARAQQTQAPNDKGTATQAEKNQPAGNVNLPVSNENWKSPTDITTGLEPHDPEIFQTDESPEFVRELVRLQWRASDYIDVWVVRPKVDGKVAKKSPVILYLYSYNDSDARFRDVEWCKRATAEGYAAVGFISALTDYRFKNRALTKWFGSELAESLGSTTHDVQLILNYLARREDIDMGRIGMFGLGSGGTIAILAAHADPRISAIDVLDPWGDWPDWVRNSSILTPQERPKFESAEFLQSVATLDPVTYLPTLKTPTVRLQQILSDPVTPNTAKSKIAAAAPVRATVVKYQTDADLYKAWEITGLSGWIKQQLHAPEHNASGENSATPMAK